MLESPAGDSGASSPETVIQTVERDLRVCVSNQLSEDADDPWTAFPESLIETIVDQVDSGFQVSQGVENQGWRNAT